MKIEIRLDSDTLIGSGEGYGALIDTDVVFDECGLPYIPAKRVKGCLRDSLREVLNMFDQSKIISSKSAAESIVNEIFGKIGAEKGAAVYFSNLCVDNYEKSQKWLKYLNSEFNGIINQDSVIETFTNVRMQTRINDGVAENHSLRTSRVLRRGTAFSGEITVDCPNEKISAYLKLAAANLRQMGTNRTRGFGEVECVIYENSSDKTADRIDEIVQKIKKGVF